MNKPTLRDNPYTIDFAIWCYHKPIYLGLPLFLVCFTPLVVFDMLYLLTFIPRHWGE